MGAGSRVANPNGNRDYSCVYEGHTYLLSTGLICIEFYCFPPLYSVLAGYVGICRQIVARYLPGFSFLVFVFSLSYTRTLDLIVLALCTYTYRSYSSFYREIPVTDHRLSL